MILNFKENCVDLEGIKSNFDNITNIGTVEVSLGTDSCKFIYWEVVSVFVFMYSDVAAYNSLLKGIAGSRDEVRKALIKYKNDFGVEHAIWKQLLQQTCDKFNINPYEYSDNYMEHGIPTTSDYISFDYNQKSLYPRKVADLSEAYSDLVSILPQNLVNTRKKHIVNSINDALHYYKEICGEQLKEIDKYLNNLDSSCGNEISKWSEEKEKILSIKSMFIDAHKEEVIQNEMSYVDKFLDESNEYISGKISELSKDELRGVYGPLADLKLRLRDSVNRLGFMELLDLYKEYNEKEKLLCSKARLYGLNEDELPYSDYINAFRYGSILISDKMNSLNRNKAKNKYIPQEILDAALIFYYDTDSAQEAYNERSKETYSQNKESGNVGEQKVDYALKWLDSSYIIIKKNSKDKVGNDCIIITNQSFIDETQEYDHLVISNKGIFSVETKNFAGKIIVDKQGNWIRKHGEEEEGIKNPIQQIRQHEKMLASFLPEDFKIISIICIANDKAIIEGTENSVLLIVKSDMLVEFIENYDSGFTYTTAQMQEVERLIYNHMV